MPNIPVSAAATGLPSSNLVAFPTHLVRAPSDIDELPIDRDTWGRYFLAARTAYLFRSRSPAYARDTVARVMEEFGAAQVARILEENSATISALRGVLASLVEADRRIATAADRVLAAEGL